MIFSANTVVAFAHALELGAVGIECDVQRAADGELVLIHDDRVERTTDGRGAVGELSWPALAALDAGGGEHIPRLTDLFAWAHAAAQQGAAPFLNLELKMPGVGPDTLAALEAAQYPGPVACSSFDYPTLVETRRLDPTIELWYLNVFWSTGLVAQAHAIGATCLALRHTAITTEVAAAAAAAGLGLVASVFGEDALWAFKPTREGNTVVLAQRTPTRFKRGEQAERCADVQERWGLPTARWVRGLRPVRL